MQSTKNGDASTRAPQTAGEVRAQLQSEAQSATQTNQVARESGDASGVRRVSESSR